MNENSRKKREWVKTAAIIFLSVMLVLTFFSNTIMNYSLPEVAIQYVQSGTVTAKIRGSGVVESGDPYNIEVKESRKVASVAVRVGDFVEQGDVILYLADEESEELAAAQEALDQAWKEYEKLLLDTGTTAAGIQAANNNTSTSTFRQQITNAQNAVTEAQKKVDELQEWYDAFTLQIAVTPSTDKGGEEWDNLEKQLNDAQTNLNNATSAEQAALNNLNALKNEQTMYQAQLAYYQKIVNPGSGNDDSTQESQVMEPMTQAEAGEEENADGSSDTVAQTDVSAVSPAADTSTTDPAKEEAEQKIAEINEKLAKLWDQIQTATQTYNNAAAAKANAELAYTNAQTAYKKLESERDTSGTKENLTLQQAAVGIDLAHAQADLEDKKAALEQLTGTVKSAVDLSNQMDIINKAQEKVDELTAKSVGATITADISGTITALNVTAGTTTSAATPVAVLQPEGKGFTMSFSVTNEQAKRLAVGDKADLVNAWRYDDVEVTLASIKPDPDDPGQKKLLTFDVTGAVTAGQTLNISVGQKSANYDYIVPNNSIREDNNGKFILVVTSKSSPLGTRYYATRVDVEVLASDDSQSAVSSGMLTGYDPVITTSTKPVEAGRLVRLAEN
ncbi:MAG: HlyD family efflux transporter periplasmic adaptor subunit [Blautia sp.]|nr:HlyD family efflux transporter periplasmic adaptor subunit [Blautia sp.]